jgi:hypothetical protein
MLFAERIAELVEETLHLDDLRPGRRTIGGEGRAVQRHRQQRDQRDLWDSPTSISGKVT